jgi:hypothetical protein
MLRDKFRSSLRPLADAISLAQFLSQIIPLLCIFLQKFEKKLVFSISCFFFSSD